MRRSGAYAPFRKGCAIVNGYRELEEIAYRQRVYADWLWWLICTNM